MLWYQTHCQCVVFLRVSDIFSAPISDSEYRNHQGPFFISTMPPAWCPSISVLWICLKIRCPQCQWCIIIDIDASSIYQQYCYLWPCGAGMLLKKSTAAMAWTVLTKEVRELDSLLWGMFPQLRMIKSIMLMKFLTAWKLKWANHAMGSQKTASIRHLWHLLPVSGLDNLQQLVTKRKRSEGM